MSLINPLHLGKCSLQREFTDHSRGCRMPHSLHHAVALFVCVVSGGGAVSGGDKCVLYDKEKETRGDEMCPSSLCNYLPIFSASVAFIIPFRSHLGVGDADSVAPLSLSVCCVKCRSPPIDLCLTTCHQPYLFPRNGRHLEIRIIINQRPQRLFMLPLRAGGWGFFVL